MPRPNHLFAVLLMFAELLCAVSRGTAQSTATLNPTADSYVQYGTQTTNYGTASTIIVKNAGATGSTTRIGFLKFDLSSIVGTISGATLRLSGSTANTTADTIEADQVSDTTWTETGITYATMPSIGSQIATTTVSGSTEQYYTWDVSSWVPSGATSGLVSIALQMSNTPSSNQGVSFKSNDSTTNKPQLVVTYNAPPTVATAASANPNPATGTTASLSVLGADDGGESNLTYTWAVTGTPPAAVTFSTNGSNAAKNTTATFTAAGTYSLTVTITDAGGLNITSPVTIVVNQTVSTIAVTPSSATVVPSGTQQFNAVASDQFNAALTTQPAPFAWTVSGGGSIDPGSGLFTAGTTAGGPYTITATANSVSGTATVTVLAPPPTPAGLTATIGNTLVILNWTASATASGYNVKRSSTTGGPYTTLGSPTSTTYTDTGLTNGTTYYYVVSATNASGESANSSQVAAIPLAVPNAPSGLTASSSTASSASLSWADNSSNETGFKIERSPDNLTFTQITTTAANATSYTDASSLSANTLYYYRVRATNATGNSPYTNVASTTTRPSAPTLVVARASSGQVTLAWAAQSVASYNVKRSTTSGSGYVTVGSPTTNTYPDTVTNGTYYYVITAVNSSGESTNSTQVSAKPGSVSLPSPTAAGVGTTPTISWCAVDGATYNIYRGTTSGGEGMVPIATALAASTTYTSYSDTGRTAGTTYYYKVAAVNGTGEGSPSNEVAVVAGTAGAADFVPYGNPPVITITHGSSASIIIGIAGLNSFGGQITQTLSALPTGMTGIVFPPVSTTTGIDLTLCAASTMTTGDYGFIFVTATSGSLTHILPIHVIVN